LISERRMIESKVDESENMQKQLQLLFDANRKLHDTNESLRDALDTRSSVFKQFNIRTPSPTYSRDGVSSRGLLEAEAAHARALLTSASASGFLTDEDGDSGLALQDGYLSSDLESERPRGDVVPLIGFNEANGPAERTFRIVMCGDASVGKSSLVMRIIKGTYTNNLPSTLGVDFHVKTVNVDGRNVALQLWDTAGQERFRSLCKSYFRRADGAILVYDVTSEQSFLHVRDWIETIKESVERHIPIILCGNKCDLRLSQGDVVSHADGSSMAAAMGSLFMETSALDGSNVEGAMLTLSRELMAVEDVEIRSTGVVLTQKTQKSSCFSRPNCAK
ncbi:rsef-1, partial [Pristionchus pacificus]